MDADTKGRFWSCFVREVLAFELLCDYRIIRLSPRLLNSQCVKTCVGVSHYASVTVIMRLWLSEGDEFSALEVFLNDLSYINSRFTYLLTYLLTTRLALRLVVVPTWIVLTRAINQWFLTFFTAGIPWTRPMSSGTPKSKLKKYTLRNKV